MVGDDCGVRRRTKEEMGTKEELGTSDWASGSTSLHCRVGRAAFMLTSRSVLGCVRGEADKGCLKTMSTSSTLPCVGNFGTHSMRHIALLYLRKNVSKATPSGMGLVHGQI